MDWAECLEHYTKATASRVTFVPKCIHAHSREFSRTTFPGSAAHQQKVPWDLGLGQGTHSRVWLHAIEDGNWAWTSWHLLSVGTP